MQEKYVHPIVTDVKVIKRLTGERWIELRTL